jgi:uncharacterized protein (DUF302 family)
MKYYLTKTTTQSFDEAVESITSALKDVGFGILTEIDMQATLKKKLNVDRHPYKILGACNPSFANSALDIEEKIGILLPCNVVVMQHENGEVEVSIMDPGVAMSVVENQELESLAGDVKARLEQALAVV